MAVPKKKTSQSRRNMRRSHHALKETRGGECSNCGNIKLSHHICPSCGYYNGRQVIRERVVAEPASEPSA